MTSPTTFKRMLALRAPSAVALLALPLLASCGGEEEAIEPPVPSVRVFTVGQKAEGQVRRVTGRVEALDRSMLSFGVGGKIVEILVNEGETVTEGQLIARLETDDLQLTVDQAATAVTEARATLDEAKASFDRAKGLVDVGGGSQRDLDSAQRALASANAAQATANARLKEAHLNLGRARLTAPFAGQVVAVEPDPFQEVAPNEGIVVLQGAGALKIETLIPESMIQDIDYGQAVTITSPVVEDASFQGVVTRIAAEAVDGNAYAVTAELRGETEGLRPGMTASATFRFNKYLEGKTAYLVPITVIAFDEPKREAQSRTDIPIFAFDAATSTVKKRTVTVGNLRGNLIEVLEGVEPGDQLISAGVAFLRDGMAARVWTPRN